MKVYNNIKQKTRCHYPVVDGKRRCSYCKRVKCVEDFVKSKRMPNGIMSICKSCRNKNEEIRRIKYHEKNRVRSIRYDRNRRDEKLKYHREYRTRLRKEVLSFYSGGKPKCGCCGEQNYEFLALDHKNGDGNSHRRQMRGDIYFWIRKNGFPDGFRVLCHNCNMSLGSYGYCPH